MKFLLFLLFPLASFSQNFTPAEINRYKAQASRVNIIRDSWGIPHIYGKTDADAVFGLLYAQCEDDFRRVEMNNLEMLGRTAEINGEASLYKDLQMRLIYDSSAAIADYKVSPAWFKKLLDASADGVNYYLSQHPGKAMLLTKFQPWYPLMRTDGSIDATSTGGIKIPQIKAFYTGKQSSLAMNNNALIENVQGSNGFALAPSRTKSHNAMLYINPHVTFYFREEVHMISNEGLNVYGAVTWGQFFIYQGFNEHCGWMHTSSHADVADVYKEKITKNNNGLFYSYNNSLRTVVSKTINLFYKSADSLSKLSLTGYYTRHGPVLAGNSDQWLSLKEYNRSLNALMQSWLRTKTTGFKSFEKVMNMRGNTTNNTVYADDQGNIAYWHGDFMPVRDTSYDWSRPVDGTTAATEWKGIQELKEIVQVHNPASGWIQNCNSTPFTVAGQSSPLKNNYPSYMAPDGENPRAINAIRLLQKADQYTIDDLINLGYNKYLSAFDILLPPLFSAYDLSIKQDKDSLKEAIAMLKSWNRESGEFSIPTTLAVEWATLLSVRVPQAGTDEQKSDLIGFLKSMATTIPPKEQLDLFKDVLSILQLKFGTWKVEWGNRNRYQRANSDLGEKFSDDSPSLPVAATSSAWGCLPSFSSVTQVRSKYRYGVNGNSFVAAVEFGKKLKAKTILTGGEGTDPGSKHYLDQADGYIHGKFKDVWFYKEDVMKHIVRMYHP